MIKYCEGSKQFDGKFREKRLLANVDFSKYSSVLYIGARANRIDHINLFKGYSATVLEIWERNVLNIRKNNCSDVVKKNLSLLKLLKVIHGDITNYCDDKYDVVMWWHGPEHVDREDLDKGIDNCVKMAKNYVILGCPWGNYKEHHFNNPYEDHKSSLQPEYFESKGFYVEVMGKEGPGSNILSVMKL